MGACPCERPGFSTRGWVKQRAHVGEATGLGSGPGVRVGREKCGQQGPEEERETPGQCPRPPGQRPGWKVMWGAEPGAVAAEPGSTLPGTRGPLGLTSVCPRGAGWAEAGSPTDARKEFQACVCGMPPAKPHREGPGGGSVLPPEVAGAPGPGRGTPGGGGHRVALGPQASRLPRAGGLKAELAVVLGFC